MKVNNDYRTRPKKIHKWTKEELDKLSLMWIDMSPMTFHYTLSKICLQFINWLKCRHHHQAKTRPSRNAIMAKLYHCSKKGIPYISVLHKTSLTEMQCFWEERNRILYQREQQRRKEESEKYPCRETWVKLEWDSSDDDW